MKMTNLQRSELSEEEVEFLRERDRKYHITRKEKQTYKDYQKMSAVRDKEHRKPMQKNATLKYKYGLTLEEYQTMFDRQNGVCAICIGTEEGRMLAVDHCHETEKVRGLLCGACNRGLGLFGDNPEVLQRAKEYVS